MIGEHPSFAVIGRINKGKSSIVATLAEDDSVKIESAAGTTKFCREYPVRVDGQTLLTLIDTPGFQQAPRMLAWLREHEVSAADRRGVVQKFLAEFQNTDEFPDECRLLEPILNGAGILYVVDGARPFRRNYEAEMEILRWTGQPRMALINQIGTDDFTRQWHPALDQYFSMVRIFNARKVGFRERIRLLQTIRELHVPWQAKIDQAIRHMTAEWERRKREAARIIAALLVDELTYTRELVLPKDEQPGDRKVKLATDFHQALRKRERQARERIERLYQHFKIEKVEDELQAPVFERDLFAQSTWSLLGLEAKQLIAMGVIAGATVGGALDAVVGGASFLTGTILGGAIGGGAVIYYSAKRLATIENITNYMKGNKVIHIGPHQNQNFPWVLLDRALLHYLSIRDRAHSRREKLTLTTKAGKSGIVAGLDMSDRKTLATLFSNIRKKTGGDVTRLQEKLEFEIFSIIDGLSK